MTRTFSQINCLAATAFAAGILAFPLQAQDEDKPLVLGSFENSGSVTFGYRFTDLSGYKPEYQELFDLESGPRLLDFSLFGHVSDGKHSFMDDYSIVANGIGGEPWSTIQVNVSKKKRYDLHINFQQSHYYWNQNDGAAYPPGGMARTPTITGPRCAILAR